MDGVRLVVDLGCGPGEITCELLPALANRHGLITGATGTGKTITLQTLAENFSKIGVPVFMADVKGDLSGLAAAGTTRSTIALNTTSNAGITIAGANPGNAGLTAGLTPAALTGVSLSNVSVTTVSNATSALATIDSALASISSSRAQLGAMQNRFASTISNLQTASENLTASRSRIQDADFAAETAALTRGQILQQAGVSVLSQARNINQAALTLLQQ